MASTFRHKSTGEKMRDVAGSAALFAGAGLGGETMAALDSNSIETSRESDSPASSSGPASLDGGVTIGGEPDSRDGDDEAAAARADYITTFTHHLIDSLDGEDTAVTLLGGGTDLFVTPCDMAEGLLCGAARLLGELWLNDDVDFVIVTLATHRLSSLLMQLEDDPEALGYPVQPRPAIRRSQDRIALMTADDDQHGFGLSMLGYRLRQADYQVYVAENLADLRDYVTAVEPLAIGISASHTAAGRAAIAMAADLRKSFAPRQLNIALGGPAFTTSELGEAIEIADLVGQSSDDMLNWLDLFNETGEVAARSGRTPATRERG